MIGEQHINVKRIVMVLTNDFSQEVRVYEEAAYLIRRGFEVVVLCWQRNPDIDLPAEERIDGILVKRYKIKSIPGTGKKQLFSFIRFLCACRRYLRGEKYEYLHCNDIDGAIIGYASKKRSTPMVFDMHEFYERGNTLNRWLWRKLTVFLLKKSVAGLYENEAYLKEPYKKVHNKLFRLKNYPIKDKIYAIDKIQSKLFRIGYHGSVRGQIPYFKALFEAVKEMPDVRVDINGGGMDYSKLKEIESSYNNVHINGQYDGLRESLNLYANTDVLFCGYDKNNPNYQGDAEVVKFYEAIVTGTPMIMTEKTGMAEKVLKNGFGVTCDVSDSDEIKKAVLKLKEDKMFWKKCAENEKAHAYLYDWEDEVRVLNRIYK